MAVHTDTVSAAGAEVRYLMAKEWARFSDDVLWRRSKLGLTMPTRDREALAAFMATALP
jgi:glycerol-3-phosphate dehydrogenase